jgi:endoglucanase
MKFYSIYAYCLAAVAIMASCSSAEDSPSLSAPTLISTVPENGATDVSADVTEINLTFDQDVTVTPMGEMTIMLNGKMVGSDISASGSIVTVKLGQVTPKTTYTLTIPAGRIINSDKIGCSEIDYTFTTAGNTLDITPDMAGNSAGMTHDAIAWTHQIYAGWCLGNTLEAVGASWNETSQQWENAWVADRNEWETGWGNPRTTEAMILAVKQAGFNAVRIPVRWYPHVTDEETMTIDPKWLARVKEVVDYCVNNGMYAIVNTHHDLWMENHPFDSEAAEISRKEMLLWRQIAIAFRDYDEHLAFAGTNEVNVNWQAPTAENLRVQNGFNQDFVKAVRQTGGRNWYRNLIVQTYSANPRYGLQGFTAPADVVDNRLIVEYHYYDPYDYVSGSIYYWGEPYKQYGSVSSYGQEAEVKSLFAQLSDAWHSQGLGIIMGEHGMSCKYEVANKARQFENFQYYNKTIVSEAKAAGIAPFVWDNNVFGNDTERFGIFDRNNNMNVRMPEFLNGIMEGAKTNYPN